MTWKELLVAVLVGVRTPPDVVLKAAVAEGPRVVGAPLAGGVIPGVAGAAVAAVAAVVATSAPCRYVIGISPSAVDLEPRSATMIAA